MVLRPRGSIFPEAKKKIFLKKNPNPKSKNQIVNQNPVGMNMYTCLIVACRELYALPLMSNQPIVVYQMLQRRLDMIVINTLLSTHNFIGGTAAMLDIM